MAVRGALTEQDVQELRDGAAAGRPGTVWFTAAAVGVPAGRSAKVVSVVDPPEGDFIQVRPAGSRDTVFCSPGELSRTRPARGRADAAATGRTRAPARAAGTAPTGGAGPAEAPGRVAGPSRRSTGAPPGAGARTPAGGAAAHEPVPGAAARAAPAPDAERPTAEPSTAQPTTAEPPTAEPPTAEPPTAEPPTAKHPTARPPAASLPAAPAPAAPAPAPRAPDGPGRPAAVPAAASAARGRAGRRAEAATSVRLTATPDGEWQAEVFSGARRVGRPVPVPAGDVAVAARALPPVVAEAITAALEGARQRQLERVERLRAELDAAQRALDQLAG